MVDNSMKGMYELMTGTWFEKSGTMYQNWNIVGLADTTALSPISTDSGAMALGTAAVAAALAYLAF